MNTNMDANFRIVICVKKLAQLGVHATGHIATVSLVVILVVAWVLTSPLVRLSDWLADNRKGKTKFFLGTVVFAFNANFFS